MGPQRGGQGGSLTPRRRFANFILYHQWIMGGQGSMQEDQHRSQGRKLWDAAVLRTSKRRSSENSRYLRPFSNRDECHDVVDVHTQRNTHLLGPRQALLPTNSMKVQELIRFSRRSMFDANVEWTCVAPIVIHIAGPRAPLFADLLGDTDTGLAQTGN